MPKVAKNPLILGRSGTQYAAMVTKLLHSYRRAQKICHLLESYCKESNISDRNWPIYLFFIIFDQVSVEFMTSSSWANLHIPFQKLEYTWDEKRYLKINLNHIFLFAQTTCLCFKMA